MGIRFLQSSAIDRNLKFSEFTTNTVSTIVMSINRRKLDYSASQNIIISVYSFLSQAQLVGEGQWPYCIYMIYPPDW